MQLCSSPSSGTVTQGQPVWLAVISCWMSCGRLDTENTHDSLRSSSQLVARSFFGISHSHPICHHPKFPFALSVCAWSWWCKPTYGGLDSACLSTYDDECELDGMKTGRPHPCPLLPSCSTCQEREQFATPCVQPRGLILGAPSFLVRSFKPILAFKCCLWPTLLQAAAHSHGNALCRWTAQN
jgi:hypothetical protein